MDFLLKYKIVILRSLGALMLLVGFAVHFWTTPKEGFTKEEYAAANVARMEASIARQENPAKQSVKKSTSQYLQEFKETRERQMKYLTIIAMIFGAGFLLYSFIPKKEEEKNS